MKISEYEGFFYVTSELLESYGIKHLFSTIKDIKRNLKNGVSFSKSLYHDHDEVCESYKKVAQILQTDFFKITKSTQIHEDNILVIEDMHIGMGVSKESTISNADGLITDKKDIPLCIFSADCVPVILADKNKKVAVAVHSGWRGTAKEIVKKAVNIMENSYGIKKEDILCAIGPSISQCCFEVSKEVIDEIKHINNSDICYFKRENGKYQLDLKELNKQILLNAGVKEENIDVCPLCTKCEDELFYSYRRDGEKAGRNAGFVML